MSAQVSWKPEEDAVLLANWGKLRCREIGDMLGRGKNSIISRAKRLECPKIIQPPATSERRRKRPALGVVRTSPSLPKEQPQAQPSLNLSIIELERNQCRYATSPHDAKQHLFCGQPTSGDYSYCAHHSLICTEPPKSREYQSHPHWRRAA
jgi:hypothetical protein